MTTEQHRYRVTGRWIVRELRLRYWTTMRLRGDARERYVRERLAEALIEPPTPARPLVWIDDWIEDGTIYQQRVFSLN